MSSDRQLVRRWRRGVLREVFRMPDDKIRKRFTVPHGTPRVARTWEREHRALKALEPGPFARSYGVRLVEENRDASVYELVRDHVPGRPREPLGVDHVVRLARLIASLHERGVIVDDASAENFVWDEAGEPHCIDFGCARVFARRSPLYWYRVGGEFQRLMRSALRGDAVLSRRFLEAYTRVWNVPRHGRLLIRLGALTRGILRRLRHIDPVRRRKRERRRAAEPACRDR